MKKRIISILLIISIVISLLPASALAKSLEVSIEKTSGGTNPFQDVSQSDWFYSSVVYALEHDIFAGTSDGTFSPYGTMTRGMFVTVMGRIAGVNPSDYAHNGKFADVNSAAYYAPYVAWAVQNNITAGIGNQKFDPNGILNREQMAVFTVRYFKASGIDYSASAPVKTLPSDLSRISSWAKESVSLLWAAGLLKGDSQGNFNPAANANRAEAAAFSARTNEIVTTKGVPVQLPTTPLVTTKDKEDQGKSYSVAFVSNGGTSIDPMTVNQGSALQNIPSPQKTNAAFLGWYKDPSLQGNKVTEADPVQSDMTLYAKYLEIEATPEADVDDSFSLSEQETSLAFDVISTDQGMSAAVVKTAIGLESMDGTDVKVLNVTGSDGAYHVTAVGGFTAGAAYQLTLNSEALSFSGKANAVRTCDFTIKRAESFAIELNEGMIYIPNEEVTNIIKNSESVASLSVPVVIVAENNTSGDTSSVGTFTYSGQTALKIGDVICVYSGSKPVVGDDSAFVNDDIAYMTVTGVSGATISYKEAASEDVIFLPDVLPVKNSSESPLSNYTFNGTNGSFTASMTTLNFEQYSDMGLSASTTIDEGDYLALYTNDNFDNATNEQTLFGEVVSVDANGDSVSVTFTKTTADAMQASSGYNSNNDISGDDLLEDIDVAAMQKEIEQQFLASGFVNEAATYLTALATETDGFKKVAGDGVSLGSLKPMRASSTNFIKQKIWPRAAGANAPSIEDLKVKVKISNNTQELSSGVRCAVEVSFNVPIDTGDNNAVEIAVSASFVEELKMSINASGDEIWKWKGIIPYISDYKMSSKVNVYNFTGISFKSTVSSKSDTQAIDISQEIQDIMSSTKTKDIQAGVQGLFELYSDMLDNETDWITLFDKEIVKNDISLLLGVIQVRVSANFVVAANVNVALGCNFEYTSGTRYIFWAKLKAKKADSDTVKLTDETYDFEFYCLGMLGLRAGINLELAVGLFSVDLNSVGVTAEAGVYAKLFGYFFYELHSINGVKNSKTAGALFMELGIYLEIAFKAQVLDGKFQYNPTLFEKEWPLMTAGDQFNVYDFAYKETNPIALKGAVKSYTLPNNTFSMTYLDLKEGDLSQKTYVPNDYKITFTNNNFSLSGNKVMVTVPSGQHIVEGDMTVLWDDATLAFSSVPIERTFHLVWDDLNTGGYTILFDSTGGSAVSNMTKPYGATVTAPAAPTKMGYTFSGWYKEPELTTAYTFTTMGFGNMTLYAKWTPKVNTAYTVKHYQQDVASANSFTLMDADTQSLTGTTNTSVTPAVRNYSGFTAPAAQTVVIKADGSQVVNYYYIRNSYTLTFKPAVGEADLVKTLLYGAAITAPAVTRPGYSFSGWNATVPATMPAANATYTAAWTVNKYTVAFNTNGGSSVDPIEVTFGSTYGALPTPTRAGYTFDGWYTGQSDDNGAGEKITSASTVTLTASQILNARWSASANTAYKVKHYQQNVTDAQYTLVQTEDFVGATGSTVTPVRKSYEGFTVPDTQTVNISADGSTAVVYQYTRNSYNLIFNLDGGSVSAVGTLGPVKYGAPLEAPVVTKENYTFTGWSPALAATMPAADTTYTAQWSINTYPVTFDSNGGSAVDSITVTLGSSYGTLPTPTKAGYIFEGWYTSEASNDGTGTQITSASTVSINATHSLYAKWTVPYTVTHYQEDVANGTYTLIDTDNLKVTEGSTVSPSARSYTGFTSPVTQTVTILSGGSTVIRYDYARNSYNLTFDANGGIGGTSNTPVKYGAVITPPVVTKAGSTFSGWIPSVVTTMPAADTTYTAQWTNATSVAIFGAKFSAVYQVFDTSPSLNIGGKAFDSSWGTAFSSGGHQYTAAMLSGRYFTLKKTGDDSRPIALYLYESDGTPVVKGISANLHPDSLIGLSSNVNLTPTCNTSLQGLYGADWAKGLVAVGKITDLWDGGLKFESMNGFGTFISGKVAYTTTGSTVKTNLITNPTIAQIEAVSDYKPGPLAP